MLLIVWKVWGPPILLTTCWHTTDLTWHKQSDLLWSLHQLTEVTSMPPLLTSNIPATDWILTFSSQLIEILGYLYPGPQLVGGMDGQLDSLIQEVRRNVGGCSGGVGIISLISVTKWEKCRWPRPTEWHQRRATMMTMLTNNWHHGWHILIYFRIVFTGNVTQCPDHQ